MVQEKDRCGVGLLHLPPPGEEDKIYLGFHVACGVHEGEVSPRVSGVLSCIHQAVISDNLLQLPGESVHVCPLGSADCPPC